MTAKRGDVWLVDFGDPVGREQAGVRPAVIVSVDALNESPAGVLMVVPLTSTRRELPSHVEIDHPGSGLDHPSYAKCEDTKPVSDRRLIDRLGAAGPDAMFQIGRVLRFLLDL